ncbi:MAG: hypothetical protein EOP08_08695 [Proteobacteria bacterium]|nr:MAG: hypothetical protein EOP08_08695 [Pseudomonadota bacterium]
MSMLPLAFIAAVARGNVLGKDNALPWHHPEDLKHFRQTTYGPGPQDLRVRRQTATRSSQPDRLARSGLPRRRLRGLRHSRRSRPARSRHRPVPVRARRRDDLPRPPPARHDRVPYNHRRDPRGRRLFPRARPRGVVRNRHTTRDRSCPRLPRIRTRSFLSPLSVPYHPPAVRPSRPSTP